MTPPAQTLAGAGMPTGPRIGPEWLFHALLFLPSLVMAMHLACLHEADPGGPCRVVVNSGLLELELWSTLGCWNLLTQCSMVC